MGGFSPKLGGGVALDFDSRFEGIEATRDPNRHNVSPDPTNYQMACKSVEKLKQDSRIRHDRQTTLQRNVYE